MKHIKDPFPPSSIQLSALYHFNEQFLDQEHLDVFLYRMAYLNWRAFRDGNKSRRMRRDQQLDRFSNGGQIKLVWLLLCRWRRF